MTEMTKLTSKYQITIPAKIRKSLHIQKGDYLHLEVEKGMVIMRPIPQSYTEYMAGLGKSVWKKLGGGEKYIRRERKSWNQKKTS